jgi:hypothetical protein
MGYEEQILNTLGKIQERQIDTATKIGVIESKVEYISENSKKNTKQISEIRRSRPAPSNTLPAPRNTTLIQKLLPYIFAAIVGAAISGGVIWEALSK